MTRTSLARPLALLAAGATFIAACGSGAATTAPTGPLATLPPATLAPATLPGATDGAAASMDPGFSFAMPSGLNADKDLEAVIPSTIDGETVLKLSMTGDSFMAAGMGTAEVQKVLTQLGKAPSDLSVAVGGTKKASIIAFRIKGIDGSMIFNGFLANAGSQAVGTVTDVTIAGKAAKKVVKPDTTTLYLYATGDTILTITSINGGLTDAVLEQIFQQLP